MPHPYRTRNTPPPKQSLKGRYVLLAIVVHVLLFVALSISIQWKSMSPPPAIAELWSAEELANIQKTPVEKTPTPPQIQEPPKIEDTSVKDADIALEEARRKEAALEAQKLKLAEEEKLRQQAEKEKQQAQQKKDEQEKQRLEQERIAAEKTKQEDAAEKARKEAQAKAQRAAEAAERERIKKEQLERIQGMTGGQGTSSTGTVNQPGGTGNTPGASAAYVARLSATLMRAITYTGDRSANPTSTLRVDTDASGTVLNITMIRSSGNADWDKAAINAIQSISPFPKENGKMPDTIFILKFSPQGVNL